MHKILSLALLISAFSGFSSHAQLEVSPSLRWKTMTTPHFEIIYNTEQQDLGQLYAEKLEKAYFELKKYFISLPEKTVVVINDKTDITNGYATRIPYPHIMAYPVLPGPGDSLADTGDWAFELLAHEYTHILNFEPANGVMVPLRYIFGTIIAPNILLPQWWKEGLAVEMETRLGSHGRLRSYYQDATIRAMVRDKSFYSFDIAQANEQLPTWPKGMRPYLFGSLMWSQMIAERGEKIAAQLNERHGARVPYFIEQPAREYLQQSYTEQYARMQNEVSQRAEAQMKALSAVPFTPTAIPKNSFTSVIAPAISPDGKHLALIAEDDANKRTVRIITRTADTQSFRDAKSADTVEKFDEAFSPSSPQDTPPSGSIQRVSWFPNSEKIIYDKVDFTDRYYRFSDLYTYDLRSKKTQALTKRLRAREPAVSLDGSHVVFVKLEGGKTHLATLAVADPHRTVTVLYSGEMQERISYPMYWDQDTILFSSRKNGNDQLLRYSLKDRQIQILFPDHTDIRFARKTSEGLLFTSGKNGVLNLYLADARLQTARPVSHTATAFFSADLDPLTKEIYATQMTSTGPKVAAILAKDWQATPAVLPQTQPLLADRYPTQETTSEPEVQTALASATVEDYSPYGYLWPRYWMPFISGSSSETGVILSAQTSAFDPLKKHSYSLLGTWDTGLNRGGIQGTYLNQVTSLPVAALLYKRSSYLGNVSNDIDDTGAALAVLPDMFWLSKYTSLQVGWQHIERATTATNVKRTGPFAMLHHANYSRSGAQISPESGGGVYLGAYNYIEQEGYLSHSQFLAGGETYFSYFLPKNHAMMLKVNAIYTPEVIGSIYGASTDNLVFIPDSPLPQYLLRGYLRGQVFGRNLAVANFEYRFPVTDLNRGSGTDPYFLQRLSGAVVADAVAADGFFYNQTLRAYEPIDMKRTFTSAGIELKIETTLGYVIPVGLVLGYYVGFNGPEGAEGMVGTALQIVGF